MSDQDQAVSGNNQQELIKQLQKTIDELRLDNASLRATLDKLQKMLFAPHSEKTRTKDFPGQMSLFDEAESEADPSAKEPPVSTLVEGYARKKGRSPKSRYEEIFSSLPVEKVYCSVADEDRVCPRCGSEMIHLGEEVVREELKIIPAEVKRIQYVQETVICDTCKKNDMGIITKAQVPSPLFQHSYASPSTVAHIMYQKYVMSNPLYRQEKEWEQMGVQISRATMANWIIKAGQDYIQPVFEAMHRHLIERGFINGDETPCQVLHEEGRRPQQKSYMWLYCTGEDGLPPIALYEYQPSRGGYNANAFLKGFDGFFTCDGYQGYNVLKKVTRCACWAHIRRYWFDALPGKKGTSDRPPELSEIGLDYCNKLFDIEAELKDLSPDDRKAGRLEKERPILDAFWKWLEGLTPAKGTRLARAVKYTWNQKPYAENYLLDGRCSISNNLAENCARPYVIGRKNFLFHDTVNGANASAAIYSLIETAKRNRLNVYRYLNTVLLYMPDYINEPDGIEELMPWSEMIRSTCGMPERGTERLTSNKQE